MSRWRSFRRNFGLRPGHGLRLPQPWRRLLLLFFLLGFDLFRITLLATLLRFGRSHTAGVITCFARFFGILATAGVGIADVHHESNDDTAENGKDSDASHTFPMIAIVILKPRMSMRIFGIFVTERVLRGEPPLSMW